MSVQNGLGTAHTGPAKHRAEENDAVQLIDEEDNEHQARDAEIDEAHRNQYWTRVVSM